MLDITPYTGHMSDHTRDRLKNAINPMNINDDPFIRNDPFVQNELEMHVPGYRRPVDNNTFSSPRSGSYNPGFLQTGRTGLPVVTPEALGIGLAVIIVPFVIFIIAALLVRLFSEFSYLYSQYVANIFTAQSSVNLRPLIEEVVPIAVSTFTWLWGAMTTYIDPTTAAIFIIGIVIARALNRRDDDEITRRIKEAANKIVEEKYGHLVSQKKTAESDVAADDTEYKETTPAPPVKEKNSQAANLSDTSVENWDKYNAQDKIEIAKAMSEGCRFGKADLGKMNVDIITSRIIKE